MRGRTILSVVLLLAIALAIGRVVTRQDVQRPYLQVDELTAHRDAWAGQQLAVHGVARSPRSNQDRWQFELSGAGSTIPVTYRGMAPSTLVDAADVVVIGRINRTSDVLVADSVLVKRARF
jgi:cytochrome c-type biogenesis protein CcmE